MKIEIIGKNGKKIEISEQELLKKFWPKENGSPIMLSLVRQLGSDSIAAEAELCSEAKDNYPGIWLTSRDNRLDRTCTWFRLETPNATNKTVAGYMYAGDDSTETDSWIAKIVDGVRASDDESKRVLWVDKELVDVEWTDNCTFDNEKTHEITQNQKQGMS